MTRSGGCLSAGTPNTRCQLGLAGHALEEKLRLALGSCRAHVDHQVDALSVERTQDVAHLAVADPHLAFDDGIAGLHLRRQAAA